MLYNRTVICSLYSEALPEFQLWSAKITCLWIQIQDQRDESFAFLVILFFLFQHFGVFVEAICNFARLLCVAGIFPHSAVVFTHKLLIEVDLCQINKIIRRSKLAMSHNVTKECICNRKPTSIRWGRELHCLVRDLCSLSLFLVNVLFWMATQLNDNRDFYCNVTYPILKTTGADTAAERSWKHT